MSEAGHVVHATAPVERRAAAIEAALEAQGMKPGEFIVQATHMLEEQWIRRPAGGSWPGRGPTRRSASACSPTAAPPRRARHRVPRHHGTWWSLENTPTVHNVICCTLCSCTAFTVIGLPPDWYKDLEYRARVVRESRTVLKEMGLELPPEIEVRVWDTTADTRYMVLPMQPPQTMGWPEDSWPAS